MPPSNRINSIDLLRGVVMIIMALDHTRDFFHITALTDDPLNLQTTTPLLFFTRWITHYCAPVFIFLSGASAYFQSLRKTKKELSAFLLSRGAWLIIVELFIMTLGITFDIHYSTFILQVIWTFGISMVILSQVIRLPFAAIFAIGVIIVAGHNLLDINEPAGQANYAWWYTILHRQGFFNLSPEHSLLIFYPFLPWTGVMILGYCFGKYYVSDVMNRNKRAIYLGAGLIVLFILLRWINIYGDPLGWEPQKNFLYTLFSFVTVQKYPPSLVYLCMTIGPALVALGLMGDAKNKLTAIISIYGKVPLFYYIIHFYVLHFITAIFFLARGHSIAEGMKGVKGVPFKFIVPGEGNGLGVVYLVWICVVIGLYPLCKWYSSYKQKHQSWWLSYI